MLAGCYYLVMTFNTPFALWLTKQVLQRPVSIDPLMAGDEGFEDLDALRVWLDNNAFIHHTESFAHYNVVVVTF